MSKRFLTWGLAALLLVAFCSMALADVPKGNHEDAMSVVQYRVSKATPLDKSAEGVQNVDTRNFTNPVLPQTPDAGCQTVENTCEIPFYIWSVPGTANTRTAMAEGFLPDPGNGATPCSVKTAYVVFYDWIDNTQQVDADVSIHADDGSGLPGATLATVTVPAATIDADITAGNWTAIDFSSYNLVIPAGEKFHVVVECPTATPGTNGVYLLSDGGTDDAANCAVGANNQNGSVFYSGVGYWESDDTHFGGFLFGLFIAADVCCEPIPPDCFTLTNSCLDPYYIWSVPGTANSRSAMAEGFDLDPTGSRTCTLKTANVVIYDWIDNTQQVDVDVSVYDDDGSGLPGTALATVTVPAATVDADITGGLWTSVDFSSYNLTAAPGGRLHVVVNCPTAVQGTSGIYLLSDGGTDDAANCPVGANNTKGSVYYDGVGYWESDDTHFGGFQFGLFITADICCPPLLFALCQPATDADWATGSHDFGRTGYTDATISNQCDLNQIWTVTAGNAITVPSPIIAGGHVLVSTFNGLECYDQASGTLQWTFGGFPYIGDDNRCAPTVDVANGRVYVGGAAFKAFSCVNLADGSVIWSRNSGGVDVPLAPSPGLTRFAPSVLIGGVVYTVDEANHVYALDAATGANVLPFITLPDPVAVPYNALTTDGTKLWVGTANSVYADGELYQIDAATLAIDWTLNDPSVIFTGDAAKGPEGFPGGMAYQNGILYYWSQVRDPLLASFPNSGSVGAIDVGVEDGTGAGILWVYAGTMAATTLTGPLFGQPSLGPGMVYCDARGYFSSDPDGLHAFDKNLGTEIFYNNYYSLGATVAGVANADIRSFAPVAVYCGADQVPYLFTGDFSGRWRLLNGNTGAQIWERLFNGIPSGTAIADDYVVVAARPGATAATPGTLTAFQVGADRPRLQIDSAFVFRTATPGDGLASGDIVDAVKNTGCVTLNVTSYTATNPVAVRVTNTNPVLQSSAAAEAERLGGYNNFLASLSDKQVTVLKHTIDREVTANNVRAFANNANTAADPLFLTVNTAAAPLAPGATQTLNLSWDETGLSNNTLYTNYVEITSDDPDFYPEDPSGATFGLPAIQFQLFIGCPDASGDMTMGLGDDWISNYGGVADAGNGPGFTVNGNTWMFDGGMVAAAVDNDHWALEGVSVGGPPRRAQEWGPTLPCGINIGSGTYGSDVVDTASFNMIDLASSNGYFTVGERQVYGIKLNIQYVTSTDPAFGDFDLKRVTLTNEADGQGPLNDFYFGEAIDWDIGAGTDNMGERYADGYALYDGGSNPGSANSICGNFRLDGNVVGTAILGSGGAPTFEMGDCFGDQDGIYHCYDMMSDPNNYGLHQSNTDLGVYTSLFTTTGLAEGASVTFYYMTYQLDNGDNANWADDAGFEAAVTNIKCRAKAFAGFAKGDVNCDGVVDLADVVLLGNIIDGLYDPTGTGGAYTADANADGTIDGTDYDLLYDVVAGVQPASNLANGWRF